MIDGIRALVLSGTDGEATLDGLLAFCHRQGWRADLRMRPGNGHPYEAGISIPAGSRWHNKANGYGQSGYDAMGLAVARMVAPGRVCRDCWGLGLRWGRDEACPACDATGLTPRSVEGAD